MKKSYLIVLQLLFCLFANSQIKMHIVFNNGDSQNYDINTIKEITWNEDDNEWRENEYIQNNQASIVVTGGYLNVSYQTATLTMFSNYENNDMLYQVGIIYSKEVNPTNENGTVSTQSFQKNTSEYSFSLFNLEVNTKYYYKAFIYEYETATYKYGDIRSFRTKKLPELSQEELVDLGLPSGTLWGSCNLEASSPEQLGGRFAYAETISKEQFTQSNYIYQNEGEYAYLPDFISATKYDAARKILGGRWRMPLHDDFKELLERCIWIPYTLSETYGHFIIGPNEKCIFLPYSIYRCGEGVPGGQYGCILNGKDLKTYISVWRAKDIDIYVGYNIRPVQSTTMPNDQYVDLGLSVNWATCDLGAISPEENGSYYAWGEVTSKDEFLPENYQGTTLYDICKTNNDAAYLALGDKWRLPTKAEFSELISSCIYYRTIYNDVMGYMLIGTNGNRLFLPVSNYSNMRWSGTRSETNSSYAYPLLITWISHPLNARNTMESEQLKIYFSEPTYMGAKIRAVREK